MMSECLAMALQGPRSFRDSAKAIESAVEHAKGLYPRFHMIGAEMMKDVRYEHPREDDLARMTRIYNDSRADLPSHRILKPEEIKAYTFLDSDFNPKGAWLAYSDGEAVAYADGFVDKKRLEYGWRDAYIDLEIMRCHRHTGIEEVLVSKVLKYLSGRGIEGVLAQHHESDVWRKDLLYEAGFGEIRRYFEMVRRGDCDSMMPTFPERVRVDCALVGQSSYDVFSRIADVRNESFVDHFNYAPVPAERFKNFLESGDTIFSVTFVEDELKTVGFVLNEDRPQREGDAKEREGWVCILGVVRSHRRRGIGRALLMDSVNWLTGRGVRTIRLLVDAENDKALGIYKSAGFETESVEILMRKDLTGL